MTLLRPALTAVVLGFAALPAMAQATDTPKTEAAETTEAAAPATLPDIALGAEDAPLTIYEYASFTCSHCASFHNTTWPKLKAEYVDTGKVRFIQRDVYFDAVGLWAGVLARCGGDQKYYPISSMLYGEQANWIAGKDGEEIAANLKKIGVKAGISPDQAEACWNDKAKVEQLVATFQQNATADEIEATPTFIIGGEKVPNQGWDGLKAIIEAKLAEAEAK